MLRGQKNSSVKKRLNDNSERLRITKDNMRNNNWQQNNGVNAKLKINNEQMHSVNGQKTKGVNKRQNNNDAQLHLTKLCSNADGLVWSTRSG